MTDEQKKHLFSELVFAELVSGRWQDAFNEPEGVLQNEPLKGVPVKEAHAWGVAHEITITMTAEKTWGYWKRNAPIK